MLRIPWTNCSLKQGSGVSTALELQSYAGIVHGLRRSHSRLYAGIRGELSRPQLLRVIDNHHSVVLGFFFPSFL